MDTSGTYPIIGEDDPLFQVSDYTKAMAERLKGTWTKFTLQNAWVDYTGGGQYRNGLWYRLTGDHLEINGIIKSGAVNTVIANIPAAYRPPYSALMICAASGGAAEIHVDASNGNILYRTGSPAAPTYLMINLSIPRS